MRLTSASAALDSKKNTKLLRGEEDRRETAAFEVMQTGTSVSHPPPRPSRPTPTAHGNQPLIARRRAPIDPPRGDSLFTKSGAILGITAAQ